MPKIDEFRLRECVQVGLDQKKKFLINQSIGSSKGCLKNWEGYNIGLDDSIDLKFCIPLYYTV